MVKLLLAEDLLFPTVPLSPVSLGNSGILLASLLKRKPVCPTVVREWCEWRVAV